MFEYSFETAAMETGQLLTVICGDSSLAEKENEEAY